MGSWFSRVSFPFPFEKGRRAELFFHLCVKNFLPKNNFSKNDFKLFEMSTFDKISTGGITPQSNIPSILSKECTNRLQSDPSKLNVTSSTFQNIMK